jgi:DNA-binding NarL/FixJ family response regulator
VRVALADDSILFREGLHLLLMDAEVHVTASTHDGEELIDAVADDPPDAVILDVRMPPTFTDEGLHVAEQLRRRHPGLGILVLTAHLDSSYAARLLHPNGRGVGLLSKDKVTDLATLLDALTRLCRGETVIDQEMVSNLFSGPTRSSALQALTRREQQVLGLMAEGRANAAIAERLSVSERTVETHISDIFGRLRIPDSPSDNRRVLAVLAWLRGDQPSA